MNIRTQINWLPAMLAVALALQLSVARGEILPVLLATPTGLTPGSTNDSAEVVTDSSVLLRWNAVDFAEYYEVYTCPTVPGFFTRCGTSSVTTSSMVYSVSSPGTTVRWNVRAMSASGYSEWSTAAVYTYQPPRCSYAVTPTQLTVPMSAGTNLLYVTTGTNCNWTATSSVNWVTVVNGAKRSSSGSVVVIVAPNTSRLSRATYLNVAGKLVYLSQRKL